jgi:hypothetical protein
LPRIANSYSASPWPGGDAAVEKRLLVGRGLLLAGIEPAHHHQHRRTRGATRRDSGRLAQNAGEGAALKGNRDALACGQEMGQRDAAAFHRLHVRRLHLRNIVHEQEFREMVIDAGALQVLAGTHLLAGRERRAAHVLVYGRPRRPRLAPVVPARDRRRHLLEVGERDAVGDEPRPPMGNGGSDQRIGHGRFQVGG